MTKNNVTITKMVTEKRLERLEVDKINQIQILILIISEALLSIKSI